MNVRRILTTGALGVALISTVAGIAQRPPKDNINSKRHPNLSAAQDLGTRAYGRIKDAQRANEYDLGGHAAKAERLLDQANQELRLATNVSNQDHR